MKVVLPRLLAIDAKHDDNPIQRLARPSIAIDATVALYTEPRLRAQVIVPADGGSDILLLAKRRESLSSFTRVIVAPAQTTKKDSLLDLAQGNWLRHPELASKEEEAEYAKHREAALTSWAGAFSFVQEDPERGVKGLRLPQIGAVHAIHAHWSVSEASATIVMPTGTGKTEAMLSVLISTPCPRVLVIVPTDALRSQIADKFLTLGILKDSSVLSSRVGYPVVGIMKHRPKDSAALDSLFTACSVVVTTSQIVGQCDADLQERMAHHCPYVFIDEAHHGGAPTWRGFKKRFAGSRILQFTATPFREDGKLIEGRIIYKYPLRKAQEEGYFRPIRFKEVTEFNLAKSDEAIAATAVAQLQADAKHNHILMARVASIERAQQVVKIYDKYQDFAAIELHSGIKSLRERERRRQKILSGEAKIVVCVDMLGEGFDLPELKIAAFHDIRKSLAVTLQIAGRFTRARPDLGNPTFVANTARVDVREEVRRLYSEDPDWNVLLPELSEGIIEEQIRAREFVDGFTAFSNDIPLSRLWPATSTVIYKTRCTNWTPENFRAGIRAPDECLRMPYSINQKEHTLIIVTVRRVPVEWAELQDLYTWDWELFVVVWSQEQQLLFINNSANKGEFRRLAQAIAGPDVELIRDVPLFRCFANVHRLRFTNVGLTEPFGRLVRYINRMGTDVESGMSEAQRRNTKKSVLFGIGYEDGHRITIGASRRGRIWSFQRVRLETLSAWCKSIGAKVLDETVDPNEIFKGTLESRFVGERPAVMPIAIDWPEEMYKDDEGIYAIAIEDGPRCQLHEVGIDLVEPAEHGAIRFNVFSDDMDVQLVLEVFQGEEAPEYRFSVFGESRVWLEQRSVKILLQDFFYSNPPVVWFADGSSLEGHVFTPLKARYAPYERDKIQAWDWTGVDRRKESQGVGPEEDSIQFRVIQRVLAENEYDVGFDDDGAGEAADVVAIKLLEQAGRREIRVDLYHCSTRNKWSVRGSTTSTSYVARRKRVSVGCTTRGSIRISFRIYLSGSRNVGKGKSARASRRAIESSSVEFGRLVEWQCLPCAYSSCSQAFRKVRQRPHSSSC